jgi:hypothetical protein
MPSPIRLVAIDIDGTLLPSSSATISARNCRALQEAQAAGLHIVIATGRRHQFAKTVLDQLGLGPRTVMISSNGSVVRHFDGTLIERNALPAATARALCPALRRFGQTMVFTFDRAHGPSLVVESIASLQGTIGAWVESNRHDLIEVTPLERAFDQNDAPINDAPINDAPINDAPIQGMLCGKIAQVRAAQQALEGMDLAAAVSMHRTEYAERDLGILDLLPPHCSKGHALASYARSQGLDAAEVMAIGDNFNDLAMLEYAGQAVLMKNAGSELQALASRHGWTVTPSNDEDGVAEAIEPLIRALRQGEAAGHSTREVVTAETGVPSRSSGTAW